MLRGLDKQFERKDDVGLYFVERIWVPDMELRTLILDEAHATKYSVHPGADKIQSRTPEALGIASSARDSRVKAARDRQKSYADNRRKPLEFSAGEYHLGKVYLSIALPQELVGIHDKFNVLNLKKCMADVNLHVPLEEIKIDNILHFVEEPIEIMDLKVKKLKQILIPIMKVCWNSRRGPEFTWEREDKMKRKYPQLFASAAA
ncbi:hypothetical protein Tco_0067301 [Tanacetum coccineum]